MRSATLIRYFLLLGFVLQNGNALAQYASGACSLIPNSQTCVDSTPCKTDTSGTQVCLAGVALPAGGVTVNQMCWQYSYQYACASNTVNTCSTYQHNSSCSVVGSTCMDTAPGTGQCDEWQYTYQCQTLAAVTQQQLTCGDAMLNPALMPTPSNPNSTFPQAAVAQELLNEGATYNNNGILFGGVQETCTKGYGGLKNCCKSAPGGQTNSMVTQIAMGAASSVVKYAGSAAVDWASPYVYDAMFNSQIYLAGLVNSSATITSSLGTNLTSGGFSVSAYGFTYTTVAPAAGSGLMGGTTTLMGNSSTGYIEFNPYVFAAAVAIAVIQDLMSCSSEEQLLAIHKGSGLSTYINEYCSNKIFLIGCVQYTDNYCSFNSVLGEIINIQGKTQLGLSVSGCQGITPAQLSRIDFSKINFSAFTQSLLQNAQNGSPTSSSMSGGYSPILKNATKGSAQNGGSGILPVY